MQTNPPNGGLPDRDEVAERGGETKGREPERVGKGKARANQCGKGMAHEKRIAELNERLGTQKPAAPEKK